VRALLELVAEGAEVRIEPVNAASTETAQPTAAETVAAAPQPSVATPPPTETPAAAAATTTAAVNAASSKGEAQSIRVSTEKIDALMNLVSEIVIAQSMLSSAQTADTDERTRAAITQMERHVRDLHERVMAIRLLPVSYLFNRFPRMVRDTAAKLGKKVNFEVEGEETELDRTLLEALSDPLTHLIRNAIDHGIEPPDERRQNGKPETGTIKLSAYQSEGRIYIEVRDDGRGINTERVREKAIQLGWITENDHPSEETLYDFLFQPGFSTAQQVSDLSGRGVGNGCRQAECGEPRRQHQRAVQAGGGYTLPAARAAHTCYHGRTGTDRRRRALHRAADRRRGSVPVREPATHCAVRPVRDGQCAR
jgi:two-component system chemotaxis sensor kinase CheA